MQIIEKIKNIKFVGKPYAAFDLDNTLLIGDIGEAVFASLIKKELIRGFSWKDYQELLYQDRNAAYVKVIEIMNGLELDTLQKVTYEILKSDKAQIEIGEDVIPIPRPNSIMQSLISLIQAMNIEVYVVTASNKVSAEIVCNEYFGLSATHILGATVSIDENRKLAYEPSEIPYGEGKVNALKKRFKNRPVITGGDGIWDKYLLDYTSDDGIRLWLGQDITEYQKLKDDYYSERHFYHIQRL